MIPFPQPNVIVVSPLNLQIPEAKRITVVKDDNGSSLVHEKELVG
jgi:hypothetical protein